MLKQPLCSYTGTPYVQGKTVHLEKGHQTHPVPQAGSRLQGLLIMGQIHMVSGRATDYTGVAVAVQRWQMQGQECRQWNKQLQLKWPNAALKEVGQAGAL